MKSTQNKVQKASDDSSRRVRETSREQGQLTALHPLLYLQQTAGNRAVGRMLQAKLKVTEPGDQYEQEADRVAERVMRMPEPRVQRHRDDVTQSARLEGRHHLAPLELNQMKPVSNGLFIQRKCAACESGHGLCSKCAEEEKIQRKPLASTITTLIQRRNEDPAEDEEETLQAKETAGHTPKVTPPISANLNALRGRGEPLSPSIRTFFEPRFGFDFSGVRLHSDTRASGLAQSINAKAFTVGREVVFGAGQYAPGTNDGQRLLAHELTHVVQQTPLLSRKSLMIQRSPLDGGQSETEPAPATETSTPGLLVEDETAELGPGQMKKSEFLTELNTEVCRTAEEALASTGRTTEGCPYLDYWFNYYSQKDSQHIERSIHKYAPESSQASTARDYIPIVTERVRRGVETWAKTGELSEVPEGVPAELPGASSAESAEGTASATGGVQFKSRDDGSREAGSPQAIHAELGHGQPMEGSVRSRMESAFGMSFSHVRVHTDPGAAQLSNRLNARAFTLGEHITFGPAEYRPGTLVGDALLAHELTHVVQQGRADQSSSLAVGTNQYDALEEDADNSAVGAVASVWGGVKNIGKKAIPSLKSGLRLQRCSTSSKGPIGATRLKDARKNFRSENSNLGNTKLDKIDAALNIATKDNLNLQISYYDYYSNHEILEELPLTSNNLATTKPNSDTQIRKDLLTPGFSNSTLGSTLIHEFVHTRHAQNVMGLADFQEGEGYGVEYVIAERSGDKARAEKIVDIMNNPTKIAIPTLVPALIENFKIAYATMVVLYEVIDKGSSTKTIPALTTPTALTADEARALVTEYIAQQEGSRSKRLADLVAWIKKNLSSFTFPI